MVCRCEGCWSSKPSGLLGCTLAPAPGVVCDHTGAGVETQPEASPWRHNLLIYQEIASLISFARNDIS